MNQETLNKRRKLRRNRARKKVGRGTADKPRLSVFRSNKHIYAQIINDKKGETIASASSIEVDGDMQKTDQAEEVGQKVAEIAKEKGIDQVVFDKREYDYHGRVEALAEGAREEGLNF